MVTVMKFGGTSVGSADAMRRTAKLILDSREQIGSVVAVVSAMGSKPLKVTDLLLQGAHASQAGDGERCRKNAKLLRQIHAETIVALLSLENERQAILDENGAFIDHYEALCAAVGVLGELSPRALDVIGGMGERMSARILAAYLRELGENAEAIDATELIVTDSNFQNASPKPALTREKVQARLVPLLVKGGLAIVTGFIAADEKGVGTTLGRGGSDYSASILGYALSADEVWIWTDVDGVLSADPRIVPEARTIPTLTYREVSELAYFGARVLHPKTMRPVVEHGIPLRIKNTFNPDHAGTLIVAANGEPDGNIKGVTKIDGLGLLTVEGKGMMGIPGIAARTFGAVADADVSVLLISQASSEQSISFALPYDSAETIIKSLESEFAHEIARRDIDRAWAMGPVSIITVVGAGMRGMHGIAGRIFTALGDHKINIIAIAQGSSECSISLVVDENQSADAVRYIHALL